MRYISYAEYHSTPKEKSLMIVVIAPGPLFRMQVPLYYFNLADINLHMNQSAPDFVFGRAWDPTLKIARDIWKIKRRTLRNILYGL